MFEKIMIAALVVTTACIGVKRAVAVDLSDHPVPLEEVTVFLPDDEVPEDCERTAVLAAAGNLRRDFGDLLHELRKEAGELGANAIHIQIMSEAGNWRGVDPTDPWARRGRDTSASGSRSSSPGGTGT